MKVLVTGASGFLGRGLLPRLVENDNRQVVAACRQPIPNLDPRVSPVSIGDLDAANDWSRALADVDVVIHAAARAHIDDPRSADALAEFRRVNRDASLNLARQAAGSGVRRLVFISSIKVNGESTPAGRPFCADDTPAPEGAYAVSKWEAEEGLRELSAETGMEVVILRPPLVYGPGVGANFLRMLQWIDRRLPLPLALVDNRRSLVSRCNLVDLVVTCLDHPRAANRSILVSDGEDLSTSELLRRLGNALQRPARLLPCPVACLRGGAALLGRRDLAGRLLDSLQVDISETRRVLDWAPPQSVDDALRELAQAYRGESAG